MTGVPEPGDPPSAAAPGSAAPARAVTLTTPFRGGTLLGFGVLAAFAACLSLLEGGATAGERDVNAWLRAVFVLVTLGVLGFYGRRVLLCAAQDDRPVPWFRDPRDASPWTSDVGAFFVVLLVAFFPVVAWLLVRRAIDAPSWLAVLVHSASLVAATFLLPFVHAAAVLQNTVLAARPGAALRALRVNASAARRAVTPTFVFLALVALSVVISSSFNPPAAPASSLDPPKPIDDHTALRDGLRLVAFGVRVAAVWAALASFRATGLVVRESPEIGEVVR